MAISLVSLSFSNQTLRPLAGKTDEALRTEIQTFRILSDGTVTIRQLKERVAAAVQLPFDHIRIQEASCQTTHSKLGSNYGVPAYRECHDEEQITQKTETSRDAQTGEKIVEKSLKVSVMPCQDIHHCPVVVKMVNAFGQEWPIPFTGTVADLRASFASSIGRTPEECGFIDANLTGKDTATNQELKLAHGAHVRVMLKTL